ncbi:rhodanese-like domain-containing protein [Paenalcaligenes hermetiae]
MSQAPSDRTAGLPPRYPFQAEWETTPHEVRALQQRGEDFLLLDCRTSEEFATARIEGAHLCPMQEIPANVQELAEHADRKIVVHCHHGARSLKVAAYLREQGFEDVTSMAGGIDLWSTDIDSSVPRY